MSKIIYEIDPGADTVIVLKNPFTSFAVWSPVEAEGHAKAPAVEEPAVEELAVEESAVEEPAVNELTAEYLAAEGLAQSLPCQTTPVAEPTVELDKPECAVNEEEIHYYVSSKHLKLASPRFKSMLSRGEWREGIPDETDGRYHISVMDWDAEAFLLLLNMLHLRNHQVPRSLSLEMLAKLAVLIDYYECAEAAELYTERWVDYLRATSPPPLDFCRDLILWICIAWILKLPHEFTRTTAVAMRRGDRELSTLGLPITNCFDRIDQARIQAIGTVILQLQDLLNAYRNTHYQCPSGSNSFECGSILYGALTKEMDLVGLIEPPPVAPYSGLDVGELYSKFQRIKSPLWCHPNKSKPKGHPCNLNQRVMEIADRVLGFADGLDLKDFERT